MMMTKEEKIGSYTEKGYRLQLLKITTMIYTVHGDTFPKITYEIRLNRKVKERGLTEYLMRKKFATYIQNKILQLRILNSLEQDLINIRTNYLKSL